MIRAAALALALSVSYGAAAADASVSPTSCLPPKYFVLGGISFGMKVDEVRGALGPELARVTTSGEDDGGEYVIDRLEFTALTVDVGAGQRGVERVATYSAQSELSSGVRVGMSLRQVGELLHFLDRSVVSDSRVVKLTACGFHDDAELLLRFDNVSTHGPFAILRNIEMTSYGP